VTGPHGVDVTIVSVLGVTCNDGTCANASCDEKSRVVKISTDGPNNLKDLANEIGQTRAVIGGSNGANAHSGFQEWTNDNDSR
jgi:hypothetical protein